MTQNLMNQSMELSESHLLVEGEQEERNEDQVEEEQVLEQAHIMTEDEAFLQMNNVFPNEVSN